PAERRADNDDRRAVGQLLQGIQQRPSTTPLWLATLASLGWVAATGWYVYSRYFMAQTGEIASWTLPEPAEMAIAGFAVIVPVLFFFTLAVLFRRTQEMRSAARSMTEVALRLAEPETIASDNVF